jgi:hypothetical protein
MFKQFAPAPVLQLFFIAATTGLFNNAALAQNTTKYFSTSIGAGYGVTVASAGEQTITASSAGNVNVNYNFSPFTSMSVETQFGKLTGGNAVNDDSFKQFTNQYFALILHADLQVGEIIDHDESGFVNALRNFYVGTGAGFVANNIVSLNKNVSGATSNYKLSSINFTVPFRGGYEFKVYDKTGVPHLKFDISYEYVTAFGQGLDGYIDASRASVPKFYNYISAGIKIGFGKARSYSPDAVDSPKTTQ